MKCNSGSRPPKHSIDGSVGCEIAGLSAPSKPGSIGFRGGNLGDVKGLGDGISEVRIDLGPGYRLYFARIGDVVVLLLCGGDKSSQLRDISEARRLETALRGDMK